MATTNGTATFAHVDPQFKGFTTIDILKLMKLRTDGIERQGDQVHAVAYGGAARAGKLNEQGDPVDCVSFHIFNAITEIGGNNGDLNLLKCAIAELTAREMISQATSEA